jgi:hypothetical protein
MYRRYKATATGLDPGVSSQLQNSHRRNHQRDASGFEFLFLAHGFLYAVDHVENEASVEDHSKSLRHVMAFLSLLLVRIFGSNSQTEAVFDRNIDLRHSRCRH